MGNRKAPSGPLSVPTWPGWDQADRRTSGQGHGGTRFGAEEAAAGSGFPPETTRQAFFAFSGARGGGTLVVKESISEPEKSGHLGWADQ